MVFLIWGLLVTAITVGICQHAKSKRIKLLAERGYEADKTFSYTFRGEIEKAAPYLVIAFSVFLVTFVMSGSLGLSCLAMLVGVCCPGSWLGKMWMDTFIKQACNEIKARQDRGEFGSGAEQMKEGNPVENVVPIRSETMEKVKQLAINKGLEFAAKKAGGSVVGTIAVKALQATFKK